MLRGNKVRGNEEEVLFSYIVFFLSGQIFLLFYLIWINLTH